MTNTGTAVNTQTADSSLTILPWSAGILILLASVLGVLSAGDNVHDLDVRISTNVQTWQGSVPEALQRFGSAVGGTIGAIVALLLCLVVTQMLRCRLDTGFVLIVAGFRLVGFALKDIFDSPRPTDDLVSLLRHYNHTGYPSGHSMTMTMMATTVVVLVWRHVDSKVARVGSIVIGAVLTLVVGWSRIWAGAHWPTDVLGGWMYGVGFVLIAAWIAFARRGNSSP